jgi:hypothetical protein
VHATALGDSDKGCGIGNEKYSCPFSSGAELSTHILISDIILSNAVVDYPTPVYDAVLGMVGCRELMN